MFRKFHPTSLWLSHVWNSGSDTPGHYAKPLQDTMRSRNTPYSWMIRILRHPKAVGGSDMFIQNHYDSRMCGILFQTHQDTMRSRPRTLCDPEKHHTLEWSEFCDTLRLSDVQKFSSNITMTLAFVEFWFRHTRTLCEAAPGHYAIAKKNTILLNVQNSAKP